MKPAGMRSTDLHTSGVPSGGFTPSTTNQGFKSSMGTRNDNNQLVQQVNYQNNTVGDSVVIKRPKSSHNVGSGNFNRFNGTPSAAILFAKVKRAQKVRQINKEI